MNTKNIIHKLKSVVLLFCAYALMLSSCVEEEDPFVDREASPVLLVFDEVPGYLAGGGLTAVPSVTKPVTAANYMEPVALSLTIYELDKSGILDHTVGIDSIPVSDLTLIFTKRDGTLPIEVVSDEFGKVMVSTTWEALGVKDLQSIATASAARSITIGLTWTGEYKGKSFARYSQVVFSKASS